METGMPGATRCNWCRILANATAAAALATVALVVVYFIVDYRGMFELPENRSDLFGYLTLLPFCCLGFMAIYVRYQFVSIAILYLVTTGLLIMGCASLITTRTRFGTHKRLWLGLLVLPLAIPLLISVIVRFRVPSALVSECNVTWVRGVVVERAQELPGWQDMWRDAVITIDEKDVERFFSSTGAPLGAGWRSDGVSSSQVSLEPMFSDVLMRDMGFRPEDGCKYTTVSWDSKWKTPCYGLVEAGRSPGVRVYLVIAPRP